MLPRAWIGSEREAKERDEKESAMLRARRRAKVMKSLKRGDSQRFAEAEPFFDRLDKDR